MRWWSSRRRDISAAYGFADTTVAGGASRGLAGYAFQLGLVGKLDDALAWLNVNLEYYLKSAATWGTVAFVQAQGKPDKAGAPTCLNKATAIEPQAPQLKDALKFFGSHAALMGRQFARAWRRSELHHCY